MYVLMIQLHKIDFLEEIHTTHVSAYLICFLIIIY